jgi:hypothetical protein
MKINNILMLVEAGKMCLLEVFYDPDIHHALGNLRKLDGNIAEHPQHGMPANFFAPRGSRNYWTKASTPELGYFTQYFLHFFNYSYYSHY